MENLKYEKIIKCFENSSLEELEISYRDFHIKCKKSNTNNNTSLTTQNKVQINNEEEKPLVIDKKDSPKTKTIKSPIVGTFYRAPSPDSAAFINEGETIKKGQTLCIIEAMKMMNELESDCEGKILEILVNSGDLVEYDQPLFKVEVL